MDTFKIIYSNARKLKLQHISFTTLKFTFFSPNKNTYSAFVASKSKALNNVSDTSTVISSF